MIFKYIWTNHFSKINKMMCACGDQNIKQQQDAQLQSHQPFDFLNLKINLISFHWIPLTNTLPEVFEEREEVLHKSSHIIIKWILLPPLFSSLNILVILNSPPPLFFPTLSSYLLCETDMRLQRRQLEFIDRMCNYCLTSTFIGPFSTMTSHRYFKKEDKV